VRSTVSGSAAAFARRVSVIVLVPFCNSVRLAPHIRA
jgi:hypothetical protein